MVDRGIILPIICLLCMVLYIEKYQFLGLYLDYSHFEIEITFYLYTFRTD